MQVSYCVERTKGQGKGTEAEGRAGREEEEVGKATAWPLMSDLVL